MRRTNSFFVPCPGCREPFPPVVFNIAKPSVVCPICGKTGICLAFPALFREPTRGSDGERIFNETDSACFYHADKKAATVCDNCGRFLCDLCDVSIANRHLCPACTDAARKKSDATSLNNERVLRDDIAVSLAILPLLVWPITIVTAPFAVYYAIHHWKSPTSLIPRTKVRFILAIVVAGIQVAVWTIGLASWL